MSDKRPKILKAAEDLFAAGRYHEVTLDDICHAAHVGKGTIYRYFEDKEDLYYQVILSGLDELVESAQEVARADEDPRSGLRHVVHCITDFFVKRRALFRLMHSEELRGSSRKRTLWKQWRGKTNALVDVLAEFIRKGIEAGVYRADFPPRAAARMLKGMMRVAARHREEMPGGKDWPSAIVDLFEKGIATDDA